MMQVWISPARLTPEDCKEWASMSYWKGDEAIRLSMGRHPRVDDPDIEKDQAEKLGAEYWNRTDKLFRYLQLREEERNCFVRLIPDPDPGPEGGDLVVCIPAAFTKWARKAFFSFPEDLYEAVKAFAPEHFGEEKEKKKADTSAIGSPLAKDLADKRWRPNREMSARAQCYVREQLLGGCLCDHATLADFMTHNAFDEHGSLLFNDPEIPEKTMPSLLRKAAKKVFDELAPGRIAGIKGAARSYEPCPLHPKK